MLRALWLVVAHDLLEDRYMDDVTGIFFLCFVRNGAQLWKFCEIIFGLKQVKAWQKRLAEAIYKEEKWRNGDKRAQIDYLRMPKLQEIFTTVAIMCHRYETLAVLAIILVWARKDVEERFKDTVYK